MTRTYSRDEVRYDRTAIDIALAEGLAKAFETAKGTFYVLKTDHGTFKVTQDQIDDGYEAEEDYFDPDAAYERFLETRYHDVIAHEEDLERQAGAVSFSDAMAQASADNDAEAALAAEDALLAKFGI